MGDSTNIELQERIRERLKSRFNRQIDILWLDLLKEEDIELDKVAIKYNIQVNEESVYKNIKKDVIWV